ncbi:substrate-binding periplasmic protein [Alkalimarinus coralli]|uniref:substrate-binding periplasmic protein n=1 Tax=Alkalimarinus coralli TaxID=2935863 RepID=UPI00202B0581|nr:transporter substrate-binding domain-containing protein [Alkalimarinus coralli]
MQGSTIKRLIRHSVIVFAMTLPTLAFAENKPFSVAYNESWPPFSFRNENNEMAGILVDIVKEVFETKLKEPVEFYGYPWKRVQHNVEIGVHDALVTTATEARLAYSNSSSEVVYTLEEKAFINRHSKHKKALSALTLSNISELENYNVCDMIGNGWANNFYGKYGIEIKRFKDINLCFRNIAFERYDIAIHASAAGLALLKKEQLTDKVEMLPFVFDEVPFPLLVSKKSKHPDILPKFDQAIRVFKQQGGIQKIVDRYTR